MGFQFWDDSDNPIRLPPNHHPLILVTYDESTFFQNDERKTCWSYQGSQAAPKLKGDGQSLMVSDFLMVEWGRLHDDNRCAIFFISCCTFF